eukprot:4850009-Pyramimonas_sp.AAC.1
MFGGARCGAKKRCTAGGRMRPRPLKRSVGPPYGVTKRAVLGVADAYERRLWGLRTGSPDGDTMRCTMWAKAHAAAATGALVGETSLWGFATMS